MIQESFVSGLLLTTPEEFENTTIARHFGFVFEDNLGKEITWLL